MADIFDKIITEITRGVDTISTNSKIAMQKSKINSTINSLEAEKRETLQLIGIKIYKLYKNNLIENEEIEELCMKLDKKSEEISEQQELLESL